MKARSFAVCAGIAYCMGLLGCGTAPSATSNPTDGNSSTTNGGTASGVPIGDTGNDSSVGRPLPLDSLVQARVRNESSSRVDVTMRFIHDDSIVNLAFVQVPPKTVTTVSSPEMADEVELSGLDDLGRALDGARFVFGVDFDASSPAEYVVWDPDAIPPTNESQNSSATLSLTEPGAAVSRAVGATLRVAWNDFGGGSAALVRLYLRPVGNNAPSALIPASPAISAQFDGINDSLTIVVPSVKDGNYEIVGQLQNGIQKTTAVAPGVVQVVSDRRNAAPTLVIVSPASLVELASDQRVAVSWTDEDLNDDAVIRFSLERSDGAGTAIGRFVISPPIAENPDRGNADSTSLAIKEVLPGLYDLVGTIDDGRLVGTTRVERAVRVLPTVGNEPPQLSLLKPSTDLDVHAGGVIATSWKDADTNDDARISFYLDSDWSAVGLDGNEQLLQSGVREDPDGTGDAFELLIPPGLPIGKYRLVGVITDGMTQVVTRAPGFVAVRPPRAPVAAPPATPEETKPVAEGDKDSTPKPPSGSGETADKNDEDKSDPAPGSSDQGSEQTPEPDDSNKNDDPPSNDGAGEDPDDDNGKDDPGSSEDGSEDPGKDDDADDTGKDPGDPDKSDDVPGDSSSGGSDKNDDTSTEEPVDPDDGAEAPASREIAVVIPHADLASERLTVTEAVPGEAGRPRPGGIGRIGLLVSNVRLGGSTIVDVTPADWTGRTTNADETLRIRTDVIPNDAWPRSFDVLLSDSDRTIFLTTKPIVVPQAVEILDISVGGSLCQPSTPSGTSGSADFSGLRITWFGGGTTDTVAPATIEFWLSADGMAPSDGLEDQGHRLLARAPGSPNNVRTTEFDWRSVNSVVAADRSTPVDAARTLAPGQYRVVAVAQFEDFGNITTLAATAAIPVCQP